MQSNTGETKMQSVPFEPYKDLEDILWLNHKIEEREANRSSGRAIEPLTTDEQRRMKLLAHRGHLCGNPKSQWHWYWFDLKACADPEFAIRFLEAERWLDKTCRKLDAEPGTHAVLDEIGIEHYGLLRTITLASRLFQG